MTSLAAVITAQGISAPDYNTVLTALQVGAKGIYGSDIVLDPDTQDGQFLGIFAAAVNDANACAVANYNGYAPQYAQGVGLANMVKINGLRKKVASNSSTPVTISGTPGTTSAGWLIGDNVGLNTQWSIPDGVVIGGGGTAATTATSTVAGAVTAGANTLTKMLTPTRGWQGVTNPAAASVGAPVESDAALRQRQAVSTAEPAQAIKDGIAAEVANVAGVTASKLYENDSSSTDLNGVPAHSISVVVAGGALQDIVDAIGVTKSPGAQTYGSTSGTFTDQEGETSTINYFVLALDSIYITLTIQTYAGYVSSTGDLLRAALVQYLTTLAIGQDVLYNKLWSAANLSGTAALAAAATIAAAQVPPQPAPTQAQLDALGDTYDVVALQASNAPIGAPPPADEVDIPIAFNHVATAILANIILGTM